MSSNVGGENALVSGQSRVGVLRKRLRRQDVNPAPLLPAPAMTEDPFGELGMEAIYEFDVKDMPVTVAVDSKGTSVHVTGPAEWQQRIAGIPILQ